MSRILSDSLNETLKNLRCENVSTVVNIRREGFYRNRRTSSKKERILVERFFRQVT
jgi:hypothetical protein